MKKILSSIFCMAFVLGLASCNKEAAVTAAEGDGAPIRLEVQVAGSGEAALTRVTGITSNDENTEAKVNSLQVFVFNGNALDGYGSSNGKSAAVSCTSGLRDIYAVVNAPSLASVTSKSALLASVSNLAEEVSNFQMVGSKTETLQFDGSVTVNVDRLAARVVVRGIKNALENAAQAADFKLLAVYLTNVAGDVDFGKSSTYSVSSWYNQRGYQSANNLGSFSYDAIAAANQAIAAGATHSDAHFFYSMPNGNAAATGGPFTPRAARLVIKVQIAGTVYDYPIALPALESNKSYEINLVNITRVGNIDDGTEPDDVHPDDVDEEKPVVGFEQNFNVIVNDWSVVLVEGSGEITI